MKGTPRRQGLGPRAQSSHALDGAGTPTVASLGVQVCLIPTDQNRERELAKLIASCEILRNECECLFDRIVELLNEDRCSVHHRVSPSPSLDV
jgi:hypothetical protein